MLLVVVVVVAVIAAVVVFRATRSTSTAKAKPHPTSGTVEQRTQHKPKPPAHRVPPTPTEAQRQQNAMIAQRKHYAARIVPTLDRSARIFDGAARGIASANGDFTSLQRACTYWGDKVQATQAQYDGIPHQFIWWTPAGALHHRVSGAYHYMQGAIQNCQEAVQATDSGVASDAVSQVQAGAGSLHSVENYARYLATH